MPVDDRDVTNVMNPYFVSDNFADTPWRSSRSQLRAIDQDSQANDLTREERALEAIARQL